MLTSVLQDRIKDESSEYAEDPNESGSDEYAELEVEADTESDDCRPPRSRRPRKNNGAQVSINTSYPCLYMLTSVQ